MGQMQSLLAAVLLAATHAVPQGMPAGDHQFGILFGGRTRSYLVHVPLTSRGALPVVLAFHGGGGNARQFQESAGLDRVADREGFLVVYPNGTGPLSGHLLTWNAGSCCGSAARDQVDDVGFVRALLADLAQRTPIDRQRIYATGHSNGGMMSYRLAVEAPDLVAAVVPVSGAMVVMRPGPSRPVPVLHIHSVDDPRALYEGGLGPPFPGTNQRSMHTSVTNTLRQWTTLNGCPNEPREERRVNGRPGHAGAGHTATLLVWGPCASGAEVAHWRLTGAGHAWPGAAPSRMERYIGPSTDVIAAAEEAWRFMSRFRR